MSSSQQSQEFQSSYSNQSSSHTFLTVPRLIQPEQKDEVSEGENENSYHKRVNFDYPKEKSEHKESISDHELQMPSKLSQENKRDRGSYNSESEDLHLKLNQELARFKSLGNRQLIKKKRESSSPKSYQKLDSFTISPQFQLQQNVQLIQVGNNTAVQPEMSDFILKNHSPLLLEEKDKLLLQNYGKSISRWPLRMIIVFQAIGKLIRMAQIPQEYNKMRYFHKKYHTLINDLSSSYKELTRMGLLKQVKKQLYYDIQIKNTKKNFIVTIWKQFLNSDSTIAQENYFRLIWALASIIFYLLSLLFILIEISYSFDVTFFSNFQITYTIIDALLNMNFAIYRKNQIISTRINIVQIYIHKELIVDILIILTFSLKIYLKISFLGYIILIRLNKILNYTKDLYEIIDVSDSYGNLKQIIFSVMKILIFSHLITCIWHQLQTQQINSTSQYFLDFSKMVFLITRINSVEPQNTIQCIFLIIASIWSILIIRVVLFEVVAKENLVIKRLVQEGLPRKMALQVKRSLFQQSNLEDLLSQISQSVLKDEVAQILYSQFVLKSFLKEFSSPIIKQISGKLKRISYRKGDQIALQGQNCDKLMFIIQGSIKKILHLGSNKQSIQVLQDVVFDEVQFQLQQEYKFSYICESDYASLVYLQYNDFEDIIKLYPDQFEKFQMNKNNLLFNDSIKRKKKYCSMCLRKGHLLNECFFLHYVPNKKEVIKAHNVSFPLYRKKFYRSDNKRINTQLNKNLICLTAITFGIEKRFFRDSDLEAGNVMSKLRGSNQNFEDSLFNDDPNFTQKTDYNYKQNTISSNNTPPQNTIKEDTLLHSIHSNSRAQSQPFGLMTYLDKNSSKNSSILVKKSQQQRTTDMGNSKHETTRMMAPPAGRINSKKPTNSTGSISQGRVISNSPLVLNQSTSIMQSNFNKSFSTVGNSHNNEDIVAQNIASSDNQAISLPVAFGSQTRLDFEELDSIKNYKIFFPSFNFESIAIALNNQADKVRIMNCDHGKQTLMISRDEEEQSKMIKDLVKCQTEKQSRSKRESLQYTIK